MARREDDSVGVLTIHGENKGGVNGLLKNAAGKLLMASGASVPSAVAGYAIGCLFVKNDNGAMYRNTGTAASCTFTIIPT